MASPHERASIWNLELMEGLRREREMRETLCIAVVLCAMLFSR